VNAIKAIYGSRYEVGILYPKKIAKDFSNDR
jgi:hypothetical protein